MKLFVIVACMASLLMACQGSQKSKSLLKEVAQIESASTLKVESSIDSSNTNLRVVLKNRGTDSCYVIIRDIAPLVTLEGREMDFMWGYDPPDPDEDYYCFIVPDAKLLLPGEQLIWDVPLERILDGKYFYKNRLSGTYTITCKVGWCKEPWESKPLSIDTMEAMQHLTIAAPVSLKL